MKTLTKLALSVCAATLVVLLSDQSEAQQVQSGAACMTGTALNQPGGEVLVVVVQSDRQSELEAKGYSSVQCSASPAELFAYKARVCGVSNPEDPNYVLFLERFRILPDQLCEYAQTFIT